ncbi:DUF2231 domain-containing protein [Rubricoccus marinus]|uniref:DUF2231 domain-containing protein n=1 Tax=Rubricoccus marinus TaxID=716817 RepID=A0A259TV20_9BACT|nr:DUF2231 domain-containing protein [Rubricoccus marinus]OZC01424.1 hypothetical protein BSZ36_17235 [Rubricoccus marinus]
MDATHLHLIVNHVPILGTLFALILGVYGAARRQPDVVRMALMALVVVGVASVVATRSGEGAEETVEHLPGVSERIIHEHEEAAEVANYGAIALAVLALGVLVWRRRETDIGRAPSVVVLVGAALVFGLMARAGNLGGQIRHTEIRDGTAEVRGPAVDADEVDHD